MKKNNVDEKYIARKKLIKKAFKNNSEQEPASLSFASLISSMKKKSQSKPFLSSLYFAGAIGDHPFFLQNDKIAIGISVLPEDSEKAGLSKCHPHQTEVIFVLEGTLFLEIVLNNQVKKIKLKAGEVHLIHPGECHRIMPFENQDTVFVFVKTNPALQPKSLDCEIK